MKIHQSPFVSHIVGDALREGSDSVSTTDTSDEVSLFGMSEDGDVLDLFGASVPNMIPLFDLHHNHDQRRHVIAEILICHRKFIRKIVDNFKEDLKFHNLTNAVSKITFKVHHRTGKIIFEPKYLPFEPFDEKKTITTIFKSIPSCVCRLDIYLSHKKRFLIFGQRLIRVRAISIAGHRKPLNPIFTLL
eukprot:gene12999-27432_t